MRHAIYLSMIAILNSFPVNTVILPDRKMEAKKNSYLSIKGQKYKQNLSKRKKGRKKGDY